MGSTKIMVGFDAMNGMRRRYANAYWSAPRFGRGGVARMPGSHPAHSLLVSTGGKMKDKNVVNVDFKQAKKNKNSAGSSAGRCCQHLEKCVGHSING